MEKSKRLVSLDVFRGLTIAGMVLVNDPGSESSVYGPLRHAAWNGLTPTDLVFPFFIVIVGVSIVLAYNKRLQSGVSLGRMLGKTVWRSAVIFALGLLMWLFPDFDFSGLRVPGVLQRIAIVYLVCSLLFLAVNWRVQAGLCGVLLIGYCIIMGTVPVPIDDVIQNALETGEVRAAHANVDVGELHRVSATKIAANLQPGVNLAAWVDRQVLPGKMWETTWDPEGLLSTFPAIASGITGMLFGYLLIGANTAERKVMHLMLAGFALFLAGSAWEWFVPFNKNLWSSPYVLVSSGLAGMMLGLLYWLIDIVGRVGWTYPFRVFGANAIAAYVLHGLAGSLLDIPLGENGWTLKAAFMNAGQSSGLPGEFTSLAYAFCFTALIYLMVWGMYKRKIFLRV